MLAIHPKWRVLWKLPDVNLIMHRVLLQSTNENTQRANFRGNNLNADSVVERCKNKHSKSIAQPLDLKPQS